MATLTCPVGVIVTEEIWLTARAIAIVNTLVQRPQGKYCHLPQEEFHEEDCHARQSGHARCSHRCDGAGEDGGSGQERGGRSAGEGLDGTHRSSEPGYQEREVRRDGRWISRHRGSGCHLLES